MSRLQMRKEALRLGLPEVLGSAECERRKAFPDGLVREFSADVAGLTAAERGAELKHP